MFGKLYSMTGTELTDAREDQKTSKRVGQYKISGNAVYMPDGGYVPLSDVTDIQSGKADTHVAGCCIGCVRVERIVLTAGEKKFQLIFDTKKEIDKALGLIQRS